MKNYGYLDCFVTPVPKKNLKKYLKEAKLSAKVWIEHGALHYSESVGDLIPPGKVTSYAKAVKLKKDELVVVALAFYRSRKHRDSVMKKVISDPRLSHLMEAENLPFDGMRMIWGGFKKAV